MAMGKRSSGNPRKKKHKVPETPRKQEMHSSNEQHNTRDRVGFAEVQPVAASTVASSANDSSTPKKSWYRRIPWWKILEGGGIVSVILYAYVTWVQWRDLRHNFEIDQRAWVRMKYAKLDRVDEKAPLTSWELTVNNVGKSPALNSQLDAVLEVVPRDSAPSFNFGKAHSAAIFSILFPGDEQPMPIGFSALKEGLGGGVTPRTLSNTEVHDLVIGSAYLAMIAQASYSDQFGSHWTRFCIWKAFVDPFELDKFNARSCVAWDSVGDGTPPPLGKNLPAR